MEMIQTLWYSGHRFVIAASAVFQALIGVALGEGDAKVDFFDTVGKSPAEVATSVTVPSPSDDVERLVTGFVDLPMSAEHRKEFIESLREVIQAAPGTNVVAAHCLLNLLEEDGRLDEALALIRSEPQKSGFGHVREIGILWKSGRETEAAELADHDPVMRIANEEWLSLISVDLMKGRTVEALRFLDFLEHRAGFPASLRYSLAIQHLEIARRAGKADELIGRSDSPILRAVWNQALGRKKQASETIKTAGADLSAADLEFLLIAVGKDPLLVERTKALLASQDTTTAQRRSLLTQFRNDPQRFDLWSAMSAGHGETVDLLGPVAMMQPPTELPKLRQACLKILKSHPEDARIRLLAAQLSSGEPDGGRSLYLEVATAVGENPKGNPLYADPAQAALAKLAKDLSPAQLQKLLLEVPAFAKLPPKDQLRYLMAADLDMQVVRILPSCKFDDPSQESLVGDFQEYFSRRSFGHVIPDEVVVMLWNRLPEILISGASKNQFTMSQRINSWFRMLGSLPPAPEALQADALNRLIAAAGVRSADLRLTFLHGLPDFVWSLPGLDFNRPEKLGGLLAAGSPPPPIFTWLSIFSPPDPGYIGQRSYQNRFPEPLSGMPRNGPGDPSFLVLVNSPWSQNLHGLRDPRRFDPAMQAKLRKLFQRSPARTLIYDLLVTTSDLNCPDAEVKAAAERRIGEIGRTPQDDPAAAVYLFLKRLAKLEPLDEVVSSLDGIDQFSLPIRNRVMGTLSQLHGLFRGDQRPFAALREKFGYEVKPAATLVESATPPSEFDRLKFFEEAGKLDAPEAIDLARQVLFTFIDSKRPRTESQENMAIFTLVKTGKFQDFLGDLKSRMATAGSSELDVQRALFRVHLYKFIHSKGEIAPYAKRILELDPIDADAATEVLEAATREQNRSLALKALETLCRYSRPLLMQALGYQRDASENQSKPDPLLLFTGSHARELAQTLTRIPLPAAQPVTAYPWSKYASFYPLHVHFLQHDLDNLRPVLRWTGDFSPSRANQLIPLAEGLIRTNRTREAVNLLAEALFTPPADAAEDAFRFQPKDPKILPDPESLSIPNLQRIEILKPLAEASSAFPPSPTTAGIRLVIELAANPKPETWNRLVPPLLAGSPVSSRAELRRNLENLVGNLPDTAALKLQLASEKVTPIAKPATLDAISSKFKLAAEADSPIPLSPDWNAAKPLIASASGPDRLRFLSNVSWPLAKLAEDAVWNDFLAEIRKTTGFADSWVKESRSAVGFASVTPLRIKELTAVALPNLKPDEQNSSTVLSIFNYLSSLDSPDPTHLQNFRPWIEDEIRRRFNNSQASPRLQFLDLLAANPAAISPQLSAKSEGNSSWRIDWSLAGYKGYRSGFPFARQFPFLDGQFDIEILAGPFADRLDHVSTIEKAAATGRLSVKMPTGMRYVALIARQRGGNIVRSSNPIELVDSTDFEPVELNPTVAGRPKPAVNLTKLPAGGPFFHEDAFELTCPLDTTIELAKLPWTAGPTSTVSGWILKTTSVEGLMLSFRTSADVEIKAESLETNSPELDGMPLWKRFKTPANLTPPAGTEKVALVFANPRFSTPSLLRFSELQVIPPEAPVFPAGLTPLGRIPAEIHYVTIDSIGNRFATASARGVGVFDFVTRQFSDWIPLASSDPQSSPGVQWMALAGDRLFCAVESGEVYLVSVSKRTAKIICTIQDINRFHEITSAIKLSPDGSFLVWHGLMAGIHLLKIDQEGKTSERLLETPQIQFLDFDPEKKTLEAEDGLNKYTLPLGDWEKSALQGRRDDFSRRREERSPRFTYGPGLSDSVRDPRHQISYYVKYGEMPKVIEVSYRVVNLPPGLVGLDREGLPFYISPVGQILQIDPTKFKGFTPAPSK